MLDLKPLRHGGEFMPGTEKPSPQPMTGEIMGPRREATSTVVWPDGYAICIQLSCEYLLCLRP